MFLQRQKRLLRILESKMRTKLVINGDDKTNDVELNNELRDHSKSQTSLDERGKE